jgi:hypothetical protein
MQPNLNVCSILAEMSLDRTIKKVSTDKVLTVQVHHQNLDPRTFKVPVKWIYRTSLFAWFLIAISLTSIFFAVKTYRMKGGNQSGTIMDLEQEVRDLKKTNEVLSSTVTSAPAAGTKNTTAATTTSSSTTSDQNARDTKPEPEIGQALDSSEGLWTGLAPHITLPPAGATPVVQLSDVKINWQGKFALITGVVAYRDQGKGSQQGHLVVLARGRDRIYAHPDNALNVASSSFLFNAENGEYFSVARFRILKTKLGPFETPSQLGQIQVYLFDLDQKLILTQSFQYGKK